MDSQIERIMRSLKCSRAEAEEILAEDKKIDRGEAVDFDLSAEEHKRAMKNANTGTRESKGEKTARKQRENPTKEAIIAEIANFLAEKGYNSVEITNKTRQISFKFGEDAYDLTLIAKRKAKS
jgi:hypothetical protein